MASTHLASAHGNSQVRADDSNCIWSITPPGLPVRWRKQPSCCDLLSKQHDRLNADSFGSCLANQASRRLQQVITEGVQRCAALQQLLRGLFLKGQALWTTTGELCMLLQSAGWATEPDADRWQLLTLCVYSSAALLAAGPQRTLPTAVRSSPTAPQSLCQGAAHSLSKML